VSDDAPGTGELKALLQLQRFDSELDHLRYRRSHLPAHETMADIERRAQSLRPQLTAAVTQRDAVAARQLEIESEVEAVEHRIAGLNARLYDGSAKIAPSDALAMSQEVKHLIERRTSLEDHELEVMETLEPLQAEVAKFESDAQALSREMQAATAIIQEEQLAVDEQIAALEPKRASQAAAILPPLLKQYDDLRTKLGGVAVAALEGTVCGGCHISLSASEVDRARHAPAGQLVFCEDCGRILVP
jgi:uncharacterized protein